MAISRFSYVEDEAHSARRLNTQKKKMRCLGCSKTIYTDRCHRFCRVCQRRNRRNGYHQPKAARITGLSSDI